MAQTSTAILNLREYKKSIQELKAELLLLERGTEEYNKVADKVSQMQKNLNQTMYDAKNGMTTAENSMNALKQQLRELQQQAGNLDIGSKAFKDLQSKILEVNYKLKGAEEGMGIFNRNVGNYSGAIIDAFDKMGLSLGGLPNAFKLATAASTGFSRALTLIEKHPVIAVITSLVALLMAIKSHIKDDAELTEKWKVAMAAFQPIVDAVSNALNFLAKILVNIVSKVSNSIPDILQKTGSFTKTVINFIGNVAKAALKLPEVFFKVADKINEVMWKAVKTISGGFAKILDAVGLDSMAQKLEKGVSTLANFSQGITGWLSNISGNVEGFMKKLGSSIESSLNRAAQAVKTRQRLAKDEVDIEIAKRKQLEKEAEYDKQISEKKLQSAKVTGEERAKLLEEINALERKKGEERIALAKKERDTVEAIQKLSPTDIAGKELLAQLNANVSRAEQAMNNAQVRNEKQITAINNRIATGAAKSFKDASEQIKKESENIIKDILAEVTRLEKSSQDDIANIASEQKLVESQGLLTIDKQIEYYEKTNDLRKQNFENINTYYKKQLETAALTIEDEEDLQKQYNDWLKKQSKNETDYLIGLNKLRFQQLKEVRQEAMRKEAEDNEIKNAEIEKLNAELFIELSNLYITGEIDFEEYQDRLLEAQKNADDKKLEQARIDAENKLAIDKKYWEDALAQFGEQSEQYLEAYALFKEDERKLDSINDEMKVASSERMVETKKDEEDATKKKNKEILNASKQLAKGLSSVYSTITDIMKQNIEEKLKNGEISEEEAKKEFERIKKAEIAMALVQTFASAGAAIASVWSDTSIGSSIAKAIMSAAFAAEAIASGMAQVNNIKKQTFEGGGSEGGEVSGTGAIAVAPLLSEKMDAQSLQQINTEVASSQQGEQRVYILQNDITQSNKQVQIRDKNTTF